MEGAVNDKRVVDAFPFGRLQITDLLQSPPQSFS